MERTPPNAYTFASLQVSAVAQAVRAGDALERVNKTGALRHNRTAP